MSIIKHVWDQLDALVHARNTLPTNKEELWITLQEEWENFPHKALDTLYESMPRRVAALVKAQGGATKYWRPVSNIYFCWQDIGWSWWVTRCEQKNCTALFHGLASVWLLFYFLYIAIVFYTILCTKWLPIYAILTCFASVTSILVLHMMAVQYFWLPLYTSICIE